MDKIYLRDIQTRCFIGTEDWERRGKQNIIINIVLSLDLNPPAKTDRLTDTVDYHSIEKSIIALVEKSNCQLIETLAGKIARLCLENLLITKVRVTIDKPGALKSADSVGVEINRDKPAG